MISRYICPDLHTRTPVAAIRLTGRYETTVGTYRPSDSKKSLIEGGRNGRNDYTAGHRVRSCADHGKNTAQGDKQRAQQTKPVKAPQRSRDAKQEGRNRENGEQHHRTQAVVGQRREC